MSNDPNNSGNNGGTTVSIPITTSNGGGASYPIYSGGNGNWQTITFVPVQTPVIAPTQVPLPNLELDLPTEKKKNSDGCVCKKCKELFPYAEPNQEDGTMICYGCRMVW